MAVNPAEDPRIDPRIKTLLAMMPSIESPDVPDRATLLERTNTPEGMAAAEMYRSMMSICDTEENAPTKGLRIHLETVTSQPDGNSITLRVIRPDTSDVLPCVYYIHGGGMASLSCFDGNYSGWGKLLAAKGVVVVMVEFRNAVSPSSLPEVAPFPAGSGRCRCSPSTTGTRESATDRRCTDRARTNRRSSRCRRPSTSSFRSPR